MQNPETRVVNQCTYVPIQLPESATPSAQPFVFQGVLANVFDEPELANAVLERIELVGNPDLPDPPYEHLATAVRAMWRGDIETSITALTKVNACQVREFAAKALEVERNALDQARTDLTGAVAALASQHQAAAERKIEAGREMALMRESILADVRKMVAPLKGELAAVTAREPESVMANGEIDPAASGISLEAIRTEMGGRMPESARFLDAIRFFAPPAAPVSSVAPVQMLNVKLAHNQLKEQTVEDLLKNAEVAPIGYLHLERMHFTPVGYEKGELVYSLPMLPGETVRLTHREWSRTETEYTKLVATEIEKAAEEELSEKSELTQSSTTQQQHSSAYNTSVNSSYSGGGFNIAASFGYNCSDSESASRQFAAKQAQEITKKATSRAKIDSKISFKVATTFEIEDQQYREIKNPLKRAVRYDFHRLMKKWRVDLYRYDVRLTYDIVVPEPGSYLLRKHLLLKSINDELARPDPFALSPSEISDNQACQPPATHWMALAKQYQVSLEPPPAPVVELLVLMTFTFTKQLKDTNVAHSAGYVVADLPEGYEVERLEKIAGQNAMTLDQKDAVALEPQLNNPATLVKGTNHLTLGYTCWFSSAAQEGMAVSALVKVVGRRTDTLFKQWQMECFERLKAAAANSFEVRAARLTKMRDALEGALKREDALMLRKIEREELMKAVLRWLLGPKFRFYPEGLAGFQLPALALPKIDVSNLDEPALEDLASEYYDPSTSAVKQVYYGSTLQYGNLIRFLHQAIEWENINYVLYPYFWTSPAKARWDFKQSLYHDDYVHRSFLRAGAARVVLTIRPGFVKPFLGLMKGQFQGQLPEADIYVSVADEIEAAARTNYPYTQDANIEKEEYLFTWEHIPGNDAEERWLARRLRQSFYVEWAEGHTFTSADGNPVDVEPAFTKSGDQSTITVSISHTVQPGDPPNARIEGSIRMRLVEEDGEPVRVVLEIAGGKNYDLSVRSEGSEHKVYREQNLVDTWYEFTPTGALDVEVGKISPQLDTDVE